ncbi:RNA polymerase subunit sigma-70 [Kribbella pratensis]|uniref:RNA polymerase sigma-70 factor (ECF subfamily) n=1 Tax=Kribbella pratensis TaxID=2512112 RepID=A0A4R8CGF7_9ACTN|nr:RNA polymerase subunit sigma-70 [Kribbella pratensis]TDW75398.1 RNA polymerase sigma-70 factor (ECF subfamily) [Kribbella pratensis]
MTDQSVPVDAAAFATLVQPYRRELLVHCYRMLGSMQDAEDALQEALVAAWRGLPEFEGRSSLRTWLYRVTTNRCLNVRRSMLRRREMEWNVPDFLPPEPTKLGEVVWLEPMPTGAAAPGPDQHVEQAETISLTFLTALQHLPRRQVAALLLRDLLGFSAAEVADMLASTEQAVHSALKRARAGMARVGRDLPTHDGDLSADARRAAASFARAYEASDLDGLLALLTDDVFLSMPPMPLEYVGRDLVGQFTQLFFATGRRYRLVGTEANGQPAFGVYVLAPDGNFHATGLFVLAIRGDRVSALTRFESSHLAAFGLPRWLPAGPSARPEP